MLKFVVTVPGPRNIPYEGSFDVFRGSGVLKVSTNDDKQRYFSPTGWLQVRVDETEGPPTRSPSERVARSRRTPPSRSGRRCDDHIDGR